MRLWNDYEGMTVAEDFPIHKLIRPEGRSAFFSTFNGSGAPAVLRLIESIHDDAEILDRWKTVASLKQANLVTLKKYGQTVLDGTPLIYAVMETTDASLAEILRERPLTLDETRQVATSLVAAVQALHTSNLVHEHIEPANVLATGDTVKLRSDCIRDIPEHLTAFEAQALRNRDIHDLSIVLLRALTQCRSLGELGNNRLAAPFDQIIRNGVAGTWDLQQIAITLTPPAPVAAPTPKPIPAPIPVLSTNGSSTSPAAAPAPAAKPAPYQAAEPRQELKFVGNGGQATLPLGDCSPAAVAASIPPSPRTHIDTKSRISLPLALSPERRRVWVASAAAAIILLPLGWHFFRAAPAQPITTLAEVAQPSVSTFHPKPSANTSAPVAKLSSGTADPDIQWRVVAYTYNRQDQAQHKADQLAQQHKSLRPEVFSPTGRAPFLVTLGGAMSREQAVSFKNRIHGEGLPRDLYAQNYTLRNNN